MINSKYEYLLMVGLGKSTIVLELGATIFLGSRHFWVNIY